MRFSIVFPMLSLGLACGAPGEAPAPRLPANPPLVAGDAPGSTTMTGDARLARRLGYHASTQPNLAVDGQGRVVLGARVNGPLDIGAGPVGQEGEWQLCVAKLDESGQVVFQKSIKSSYTSTISALALDDRGDVAVVGQTNEPIDFGAGPIGATGPRHTFVVKLDPDGNPRWSHAFKDTGTINAVGIDRAGNVVIAGATYSPLDLGGGALKHSGSSDAFVASFDAEGKHRYSRSFGTTSSEVVTAMAVDSAGQIVLVGTYTSNIDFGNGPMRGQSSGDVFVLKLDADGRTLFAQRIGGEHKNDARSVAVDARGNIVVSATMQRSSEWNFDATLLLFDPHGNEIWRRGFTETTQYSDTRPVAFDAEGNVVAAGPRFEEKGGSSAAYVVKLRADGEPLYARKFEGPFTVMSLAASQGTGEAFLLGVGGGAIRYGKREMPAATGQSMTLLLKLAP